MKRKTSSGQSLLEMVVIIGVTGVALVGVALAATVSIKNARVNRDRAQARNYATDTLEEIKTEKKNDPEAFFAAGSHTETLTPTTTTPIFNRTVTYTEVISNEKIGVALDVSWIDSNNTYHVTQETTLERYNE